MARLVLLTTGLAFACAAVLEANRIWAAKQSDDDDVRPRGRPPQLNAPSDGEACKPENGSENAKSVKFQGVRLRTALRPVSRFLR
jgi:hypothetical protein